MCVCDTMRVPPTSRHPRFRRHNVPPINPSHVFLGDSLISGVLPKKNPARYAAMSLTMTSDVGSRNQMIPSKIFDTKNELGRNTVIRIICVHANCPN